MSIELIWLLIKAVVVFESRRFPLMVILNYNLSEAIENTLHWFYHKINLTLTYLERNEIRKWYIIFDSSTMRVLMFKYFYLNFLNILSEIYLWLVSIFCR